MTLKKTFLSSVLLVSALVGYTAYGSDASQRFDAKAAQEFLAQVRASTAHFKAMNIVNQSRVLRRLNTNITRLEVLDDPTLQKFVEEIKFDPILILERAFETREIETIKDSFSIVFQLALAGKYKLPLKFLELTLKMDDQEVLKDVMESSCADEQSSDLRNVAKLIQLRDRAVNEKWCSKDKVIPHLKRRIVQIKALERAQKAEKLKQERLHAQAEQQEKDAKEKFAEEQKKENQKRLQDFPQTRLNPKVKAFVPKDYKPYSMKESATTPTQFDAPKRELVKHKKSSNSAATN